MKILFLAWLVLASWVQAHPLSFNSTISYASNQPSGSAASVSNWTGAAFDAANIGGSGVNADGGANNGTTNDSSTCVWDNGMAQGQTFTTGANANGYQLTGFTVRLAGYTSNTASGTNVTSWNLSRSTGPMIATIGKISGTTHSTLSMQNFMGGGTGTPGTGNSANGSGTYLTFNLPFPVHLDSNTTYSFDLATHGSANRFELLGTSANPYASGAAYTRGGTTVTPRTGDRVFQANLTATPSPHAPFTHPGTLHTQADFDRMTAKIAASAQPWKGSYDLLLTSAYAQTGWPAYDIDYINRGGAAANNYTRSQQDAQAIYQLALRWKLTGDVAYANRAVQIANVWSGLLGVTGDTNGSLASGICGYLFAIGGEILSTYPGWPAAEEQAYKDMMMRVFYPANFDFLWRHHGTPNSKGGNTHYRLNWDTANMASMAAIGILCDNQAVYQQAVDYFKSGPGNGNAQRAAWYIHPDGTTQTEESGRDQPHNAGGWYAMGLLCQMAWNQGEDLFGYDNNRVLRAYEYNAKYNLGNDVSWVYHRNASLTYTETLSDSGRGLGGYPSFELIHNHYANVKGIATPWSRQAMNVIRPEAVTGPGGHPSGQDCLGLGSLTYARDNANTGTAPGGLLAQWSKNRVILNWWGTATATSYQIQRASTAGNLYTTIGTAVEPNLNFTDTNVTNGASYHYKVVAITPTGNLESAPLLAKQSLVARYTFEGSASDVVGTRHATALGGATAPGYASGFGGGQAILLNGSDQYVQLPAGSGLSRDITLSAWVYWNGGNAWQRVFDFGSEIEKYMMLTVKNGAGKLAFQMTTSRASEGTVTIEGPTMPTATWTHLAVTINGGTATLYVNGLPVGTAASPDVAPMFSQPFCYLGRSMWNGDPLFNGRIDDFLIANHALTGNEVHTLWGEGGTNSAPVFEANPMMIPNATEESSYHSHGQTLADTAADVNGGTLTFLKVTGPSWLEVAANGALSGTPSNSDIGENLFVVRVMDTSGASDDANLYITVDNINDLPVWTSNPLTKPAVTPGIPYGGTLADNAGDVDPGFSITFSKITGPSWLTVSSNGTLSGTPFPLDAGNNNFVVRATDNTGASADATLNIPVMANGLQACYTLDGSGADSQNGPAATVTGPAGYTTGIVGQALSFDGSTNHVTLGAFSPYLYKDITVAAWVWWDGGGPYQRIFDFGSGTDEYLFLTPSNGSSMRFAIKKNGLEQTLNTTPLPTATWAHVAVTLGGNTATIYVNGVAKASSNSITNNPNNMNLALNSLGKSPFVENPLFAGKIDDFRIYNYALNSSEIAALLSGVPAITPSGLIASPNRSKITLSWNPSATAQTYNVKRRTASGTHTTVATGLSGTAFTDTDVVFGTTYYYVVSAVNGQGESINTAEVTAVVSDLILRVSFDESSGTAASDSSGNLNDGTLVNTATRDTGYYGNAVNLAGGIGGTASQHVTLPNGVLNGLTDYTISCWVKIGAFITNTRIFDFGNGTTPSATAGGYMFLTPQYTTAGGNAAKMRFAITTAGYNNEINIMSNATLTAGTWAQVAVTRSGNTGSLYLNGNLVGTNTSMLLSPANLGATSPNYLGRSQYSGDAYLNGALDDFRIYSRALSATEISALGKPAAGIPTLFTAVAGDGEITLSWSPNATTSYTLKRSTSSGGPYLPLASGVTDLSHVDTAVANDTTYYYVISGTNPLGTGSDSTEVAATPSSLRVHLKFDESNGTIAADSSGHGVEAFLTNTPVFEAGRLANALKLTQASSQYAMLPTGIVSGLTSATLMCWVKTSSVATWQRIFDFGSGSDNYMFLTTQFGTGGNANKLRFAMRTPGVAETAANQINSSVPSPAGSWAHVAVVLSGSIGTLYLNGVQVGQSTSMTLNPDSLGTTTLNYLGKSQFNDPYLNASLDDFRIYSRALAEEEIEAFASPLIAPQNLEAIASFQHVDLSWDAVSYAASYSVRSSTTSGGPYTVVASGLTSPNYTHTGLPPGMIRYYVVDARNVTGTSGDSAEASATPISHEITQSEIDTSSLAFSNFTGSGIDLTMAIAHSVVGHTYQLQYSPDLTPGSWEDVGAAQTGTGTAFQIVLPLATTGQSGFFRISIRQ